ncbi:hypothetical protein Tsubulata_031730 [Turnera subulata]|uniref:Glycosyltransferase n=1 Tax=Turnera subulata TaxID=218843 RepID=A0A9Q0FDW5_9ROSI|nr:hypothetical protein Tsubulata_031730 [Turnera subulata]
MTKAAELVFIPTPAAGHLVPAVELAERLTDRDERLSITVLLIKPPYNDSRLSSSKPISSIPSSHPMIKFVHLPDDGFDFQENFLSMGEILKPQVREVVSKLIIVSRSSSDKSTLNEDSPPKFAGFVLDMFCTALIDVANEFGVPSYIFFPSGTAFLGVILNIQAFHDEQGLDPTDLNDSDAAEVALPSLVNPLPVNVLPIMFLQKNLLPTMLAMARRLREATGIIVNTFSELEPHTITSLADGKTPPAFHDEQGLDPTDLNDSDAAEVALPSLVNPLPVNVLPIMFLQKNLLPTMLAMARRLREATGIIVNTFSELEPHTITSLADGKTPPVYPVGPILNLRGNGYDDGGNDTSKFEEIIRWLDDQPPSSVVFLCFGSFGSFDEEQVKEIARALENIGLRFLWSLRKPPPQDKMRPATEYSNPQDVLPDGFLDRTAKVGKIIGWAPQVEVLAHPSIGGFVSHCGWNSTLESIWFGVPVGAWPLYAEQQLNAFELVVELGLAVEIRMDYRKDWFADAPFILTADEIERGIRNLMDPNSERTKVLHEISEKSKRALAEGGSSYISTGRLIQNIMDGICCEK